MYHSVQDVVLVVCVWVGLNQWAIWELIERERRSCRLRQNKARAQYTNQHVPYFYAKRLPAAGEG
jgi:hypothetical protein